MTIWSADIKELEVLYTALKDHFPDLEKEFAQLIRTDDANVVMLYSRRCLEVMITDLCEKELHRPRKTEPLKGIIDKLNREEVVPAHIITSMHGLNDLSTYGTHPKEFEPEQVRPVLINLTTIIRWYLKYRNIESVSPVTEAGKHDSTISIDKSVDKKVHQEKAREATGSQKSSRAQIWKIVSYISILIIVVLIVIYAAGERKKGKDLSGIEKSIAVLPFENWSQSEEFAYLGDAMANEISTHLANIAGFHVFSFSSTSKFKGLDKPSIQQIGKKLGANFIIEGSVERQDQDVSIHVQVIQAANDDHLWAEEFKGQWKDIFTLRASITKKVAAELETILSPEEIKKIENKPTNNLKAYDYFLLGRHSWNQRSVEEILKAKAFFEKAIETDPAYALAYAGLAQLYCTLPVYISWRPGDAYPHAMTLALKALELDRTLTEAYTAMGAVKGSYYWDVSGSVRDFEHAIQLNPNHSTTYHWYAENLFYKGDFRKSLEMFKKALQIDPLSPVISGMYGFLLYYNNQKDSAISYLQNNISTDPEIGYFHLTLGLIYLMEKEYKHSVEELQKAVIFSGEPLYYLAFLGEAYNKMGKPEETKKILDTIEAQSNKEMTSYFPRAMLLSELGKKEEALKCLQMAYEERMEFLQTLKYVNRFSFSNLRSDPRFIEIMDKVWQDGKYGTND
jgi:TolB-like protein/Tfp pilus assembly protein PilF